MSLRISGGYLRGRVLKTLPGQNTRPTAAKVREALFSILQHDIADVTILDLFAGSGAVAIEALSRGATEAVLVEKNRRALAVIRENLAKCDLDPRVLAVDYKQALKILEEEEARFDIIFADPPYKLVDPDKLRQEIAKFDLIRPGGLLIIEHDSRLTPRADNLLKIRSFGDTAISFFKHE